MPAQVECGRVRTKAELKQPVEYRSVKSESETETTDVVKSEPSVPGGQADAVASPSFPPGMMYNPVMQGAFGGVPWMMPNVGLNPLYDSLMMHPNLISPGMIPGFLPHMSSSSAGGVMLEQNGVEASSSSVAGTSSTSLDSRIGHIVRETKRRSQKSPKSRSKTGSSWNSKEQASNPVTLEHSYTMPPSAAKKRRSTSHKRHSPVPLSNPRDPHAQETAPHLAQAAESCVNSKCPTVKELLAAPALGKNSTLLALDVKPKPLCVDHFDHQATSASGRRKDIGCASQSWQENSDLTRLSGEKSGEFITSCSQGGPTLKSEESSSALSGSRTKLKSFPVPSISHAIEMVKLQQQMSSKEKNVLQPKKEAAQEHLQKDADLPIEVVRTLPFTDIGTTEAVPETPEMSPTSETKSSQHLPLSRQQETCNFTQTPQLTDGSPVSDVNLSPVVPSATTEAICPQAEESDASQQTSRPSVDLHSNGMGCVPNTPDKSESNSLGILADMLPGSENESQNLTRTTDLSDDSDETLTNTESVEMNDELSVKDESETVSGKSSQVSQAALEPELSHIAVDDTKPKLIPVITVQCLKDALTQLCSVSAVAIPPHVCGLNFAGTTGDTSEEPKNGGDIPSQGYCGGGSQDKEVPRETAESSVEGVEFEHIAVCPSGTDAPAAKVQDASATIPREEIPEAEIDVRVTEIPKTETAVSDKASATAAPNEAAPSDVGPSTQEVPGPNQSPTKTSSFEAIQMLKCARPRLGPPGVSPPLRPAIQSAAVRLTTPTLPRKTQWVPLPMEKTNEGVSSSLVSSGMKAEPIPGETARSPIQEAQASTSDVREEAKTSTSDVREEAKTSISDVREEAQASTSDVREEAKTSISDVREEAKTSTLDVREESSAADTSETTGQSASVTNSQSSAVPGRDSVTLPASSAVIPSLVSVPRQPSSPVASTSHYSGTNVAVETSKAPPSETNRFQKVVCAENTSQLAPATISPFSNPMLSSEAMMAEANFLANAQMAQAVLGSMNQAFSAHLISQMALAQFGGLPGTLPFLNPFFQEPLNPLAAWSQTQSLPCTSLPNLPIMNPGALNAFPYGATIPSVGVLGQMSNHICSTNATAPSVSSQGSDAPLASRGSKTKRKPIESQTLISVAESQSETSTRKANADSRQTEDTTEQFEICSGSISSEEKSAHLKNADAGGETSGTLSAGDNRSNIDRDSTEVLSAAKRQLRSDSQDSSGAASDGTVDSESPVSTPTTASVPGWFGKGLNVRKGKRKRTK